MPNPKKRTLSKALILIALLSAAAAVGLTLGILHLLGYHPAHVADTLVAENGTTLYTCSMHPWIVAKEPGNCPICGMRLTRKRDGPGAAPAGGAAERRIAYWRAPMNPTEIYAKPGKSAMGMDLVPVYEDELVGGVTIAIDPVVQQNMGLRIAAVTRGPLTRAIRTYGHVTYDETRSAEISPKISGWIERIHVDFVGKSVEKGAPLFEIYAPELVAAQEEFLATRRGLQGLSGGDELLAAAHRRLAYFDVPEEEIAAIEASGRIRKTLTIRSPFSGVVILKAVEEGSFVRAGTTVFRIADLSRVWVEAHIFEYELPWVAAGQEAVVTVPYHPGRVFNGLVTFVYPYLQRKTRDVVVRLEFENPDMALKPDMYVDVRIFTTAKGEGTIVPAEAVLRSGERNVVFVRRADGKFTPREVALGLDLDERRVQVLTGLAPGERVVTSGQFLLDSESKLREAVQKMLEPPAAEPTAPPEDFFEDMESPTTDAAAGGHGAEAPP